MKSRKMARLIVFSLGCMIMFGGGSVLALTNNTPDYGTSAYSDSGATATVSATTGATSTTAAYSDSGTTLAQQEVQAAVSANSANSTTNGGVSYSSGVTAGYNTVADLYGDGKLTINTATSTKVTAFLAIVVGGFIALAVACYPYFLVFQTVADIMSIMFSFVARFFARVFPFPLTSQEIIPLTGYTYNKGSKDPPVETSTTEQSKFAKIGGYLSDKAISAAITFVMLTLTVTGVALKLLFLLGGWVTTVANGWLPH